MMKYLIIISILLIACEAEQGNTNIDVSDLIHGDWQTEREDSCRIITSFLPNDSIINVRNIRVIKGLYELKETNNGYFLKADYTFDDQNLAGSCDGDSFIFEGSVFYFRVELNDTQTEMKLFDNSTNGPLIAVLNKL